MLSMKYIFDNWTEKWMCGDYLLVTVRPSRIGIPCRSQRSYSMPSDFPESLAPWTWDPAITNSLYLRVIEWKPHYRELIRMGKINCTIQSFFHLASRMHMVSFREWWTKSFVACPFLDITLMMWSYSARHRVKTLCWMDEMYAYIL